MNHSAYINPRIAFRRDKSAVRTHGLCDPNTIHVNPNFQPPRPQNVYVNPLFVVKPSDTKTQNKDTPKPGNSGAQVSSKYTWKRRISDSKHPPPVKPLSVPKTVVPLQTHYLSSSGKKLIRRRSTNKSSLLGRKVFPSKKYETQFKLDKRPICQRRRSALKTPCLALKNIFRIEGLFPKNVYKVNHKKIIKGRTAKDSKTTKRKIMPSANKKLVSIGGILYRASVNKLTRTSDLSKVSTYTSHPPATTLKKLKKGGKKVINKHVINIRGESFVLSKNGATLTRVSASPVFGRLRKRVDFGGVTFRQTSQNVLVRTSSHYVRNVLQQAKQKSIACLTIRRRKINVPCTVFRKLGKCLRYENGGCPFTHDKKNVDLCKRFLRGECADANCLLSHEVVHQKVATCRYYLKGSCGRENCPYLHVKVSSKAAICEPFLQGFCDLGHQCPQRHINICPDFEKSGYCRKGRKCSYPHKGTRRKGKSDLTNLEPKPETSKKGSGCQFKVLKTRKRKVGSIFLEGHDSGQRYYSGEPCSENVGVVPKRQRLDSLPSYIAIERN